jgi:hypothetical protein
MTGLKQFTQLGVPDKVIEYFNLPNPSSRTMALGLTQPVTEMRTSTFSSGVKRGRRVRLICEQIVWTMWDPQRLTTIYAS